MTTPTQTTPALRRPRLNDYLALWLLKLSKMRRRSLSEPVGDDYDKFYEEFFDKKDLELYVKDCRSLTRQETILDFLQRRAPDDTSILDVGCGLGEILGVLPEAYILSGMDYAKHNVAVSAKRLGSRATIKQGSIYEIPFPSNSFDVCLCLEVLEHIEEDARGTREIARVLKPGGFLLAAVPYTFYWPQYLKLMGHFRHYTRQSFTFLMEQNGLKVEAHLRNYPNWHQAYTRRYSAVRAQAQTVGRVFRRSGIYEFRWPWHRDTAIDRLNRRLEPLRHRDAQLDYACLDTSTFLVARKPGDAA